MKCDAVFSHLAVRYSTLNFQGAAHWVASCTKKPLILLRLTPSRLISEGTEHRGRWSFNGPCSSIPSPIGAHQRILELVKSRATVVYPPRSLERPRTLRTEGIPSRFQAEPGPLLLLDILAVTPA